MKVINARSLGHTAILITACSLSLSQATEQSPAPSSLSIVTAGNITVTVNDPANHVWVVQRSSDLMTLPALEGRLDAEPFYTNLFNMVFNSPVVTSRRISLALAQFVRSIISLHSKFDQGPPVGFANFTPQENLGRQIFFGQVGTATCAACHGTDNFVAPNIFNNGLEFPYVDLGVGGITGHAQEQGLFKVPSLRNIELTAPYMHDGRFATLEQVVEFYSSGVVDNPNLAPPLRVPTPPGAPWGRRAGST